MVDDRQQDFEEAYDGMRPVAYRAAYRLLGQRNVAEDIADEALARAYSRWPSVATHADARVVIVATNLALDIARQRARAARPARS